MLTSLARARAIAACVTVVALLAILSLWAIGPGASAAPVGGTWSTYNHDPARSGVDPDQPSFDTITQAWGPITLDGQVFGQPLVVGNQVLVTTENNSVYSP